MLWRPATGGGIELAVVHRPRYDDWSWPKGGVEAGEHVLQAAAREIGEETGHRVRLTSRLGHASYQRPGGTTTVQWWAARAVGGEVELDVGEVDDLRWVTPEEALRTLTYRTDRAPLRRLLGQPLIERTVALVRHASAGSRRAWAGRDDDRPLDELGREQALALAAVLPAFAPTSIAAAELVRCRQTVAPLADRLGLPVAPDARLSDASSARDAEAALDAVRLAGEAAQANGAAVLCSQGETIPAVVRALVQRESSSSRSRLLSAAARNRKGQPRSRKGSVWLLHFAAERLVATDYVAAVLPADDDA